MGGISRKNPNYPYIDWHIFSDVPVVNAIIMALKSKNVGKVAKFSAEGSSDVRQS